MLAVALKDSMEQSGEDKKMNSKWKQYDNCEQTQEYVGRKQLYHWHEALRQARRQKNLYGG